MNKIEIIETDESFCLPINCLFQFHFVPFNFVRDQNLLITGGTADA
jgi:hypothetical protein